MVDYLPLGGRVAGNASGGIQASKPVKKATTTSSRNTQAPKATSSSNNYYPSYSPPQTFSQSYSSTPTGAIAGAAAPAAPGVSEASFLVSDPGYKAQLAALTKALSDYQASNNTQLSQYNTDYGKSLKSLGWDPTAKDWNTQDQNTSSGRAVQNLNNDFASRGLLQSSLFGEADNNLMRSLNDQLSSIDTAKQNYSTNLAQQLAAYKNQNLASQQQAKADALARYAAQYGS